jgi:Flp pilus assembly protein TadD
MSTIRTRRRLIRSPMDHRRGGFLRAGASGALLLATGLAACGGDVQETTTSRIQARPATEVGAPPPQAPPVRTVGMDPASTPGEVAPQETVPVAVDWETAETAWRQKNYPRAVELFTVWSGERPDNPWGHYMLGLSRWKAGNLEEAEASLVGAVELDPGHRKALVNLARVRLDQGRPEEAEAPARSATELDPASPDGWRVLGRVHHSRGEVDQAILAYQTAALLDRGDAWALNNLGLLMIQQERFEEALGPLAQAAVVDSTLAVVQNNLGMALERTGRTTQALVAYGRAVELGEGGKAEASLARLTGYPDRAGVMPVELPTVALRFTEELATSEPAMTLAVLPPQEGRDLQEGGDPR